MCFLEGVCLIEHFKTEHTRKFLHCTAFLLHGDLHDTAPGPRPLAPGLSECSLHTFALMHRLWATKATLTAASASSAVLCITSATCGRTLRAPLWIGILGNSKGNHKKSIFHQAVSEVIFMVLQCFHAARVIGIIFLIDLAPFYFIRHRKTSICMCGGT